MGLPVFTVLVVILSNSYGHYITLPLMANGGFLAPFNYQYVVHHAIPDVLQHPEAGPVSRETLEDHSDDGFLQNIPDISEEQANLNPDDAQLPEEPDLQRPVIPRHPPQRPIEPQPHIPTSPKRPQQPRPSDEEPNINFNGPQADGSYDFSYTLGDQSRKETADANGNVQGTYSYKGPDGKEIVVTYTAGAKKGYIPVGEGLLPPPVNDEGHGNDPEIGDNDFDNSGEDRQQHMPPIGPTKTPQNPTSSESGGHGGMPYSYNYDAELSSKSETADDQGNVEGSYTYIDGAGVKRTVKYTVRGDEGFVVTGDIHPDPGTREPLPQRPVTGRGPVVPPRPLVPNLPPPTSHGRGDSPGVKGRPRPPLSDPTSVKGGRRGSSWDKYPLGG